MSTVGALWAQGPAWHTLWAASEPGQELCLLSVRGLCPAPAGHGTASARLSVMVEYRKELAVLEQDPAPACSQVHCAMGTAWARPSGPGHPCQTACRTSLTKMSLGTTSKCQVTNQIIQECSAVPRCCHNSHLEPRAREGTSGWCPRAAQLLPECTCGRTPRGGCGQDTGSPSWSQRLLPWELSSHCACAVHT